MKLSRLIEFLPRKIREAKWFKRFLGFSSVGVIVTLFSMFLTFMFNDVLKINVFISYIMSFSTSIIVSYFMNAKFVFKSAYSLKRFVLYYGIYVLSMFLGLAILKAYSFFFPDWNKTIITYMVLPFTILFNFFFVSKIMTKFNPK
jgi:putative flippase GtrA